MMTMLYINTENINYLKNHVEEYMSVDKFIKENTYPNVEQAIIRLQSNLRLYRDYNYDNSSRTIIFGTPNMVKREFFGVS